MNKIWILYIWLSVLLAFSVLYVAETNPVGIKSDGIIYMDGYTFIFTEDFNSSWAGYTYENKTIYMRPSLLKDETEFIRVCNHEILHHFVDVEKDREESFIMQIDTQVKLPTCDKLLKTARLVIR